MDLIINTREAPISTRREPVVGWRLWRIRDTVLHSWSARHQRVPRDNAASCPVPGRCPHSPGEGCMCGFWAVDSPLQVPRVARVEPAEHASVIRLFTDWAWDAATLPRVAERYGTPLLAEAREGRHVHA
jgi:hypothetical protein